MTPWCTDSPPECTEWLLLRPTPNSKHSELLRTKEQEERARKELNIWKSVHQLASFYSFHWILLSIKMSPSVVAFKHGCWEAWAFTRVIWSCAWINWGRYKSWEGKICGSCCWWFLSWRSTQVGTFMAILFTTETGQLVLKFLRLTLSVRTQE